MGGAPPSADPSLMAMLLLAATHVQGSLEDALPPDVAAARRHSLPIRDTPRPAWKAPPPHWAMPRGLPIHVDGADGEGGLLLPPSPPRALPQRRRTDTQSVTYDQLRQELAAAAPGASLNFSLAPGEALEVEEQLVVSGITVSISSSEPGATISRAEWANNSRVFEVRDGGHLLLARVNIANGRTDGEDGGCILVQGEGSILTAEDMAVSDCQVLDQGGGAFLSHLGGGIAASGGGQLRLEGVLVERCCANGGGGIALQGSSGAFTDCWLQDCTTNPAAHDLCTGAGIYLLARSVATWHGGGIANCSTGYGYSGGMYCVDSQYDMRDAIISGCRAKGIGGTFIGSGFLGDTEAPSIGNHTNVSISDWCARFSFSRVALLH